ncbi:hypothetical protein EYC84_003145 [Monilinia fructicola]|uniref:Uncharacterized protein n=1 Tax=Monilinia fructicola TaxID=38448 RepID=A0A5M9K0V9_MONFR|nr:hypothetical protein EYC84_003145 [Monilinia fructicola]
MVIWRYVQSCGRAFARVCFCEKRTSLGTFPLFFFLCVCAPGKEALESGISFFFLFFFRAHAVGFTCEGWAFICYIGIHYKIFFPSTYLYVSPRSILPSLSPGLGHGHGIVVVILSRDS